VTFLGETRRRDINSPLTQGHLKNWWKTKTKHTATQQKNLFELEKTPDSGASPLTVGFIVTVKDPRSHLWFNSGNGHKESFTLAETAIFNETYYFGGYTGYVRVINKKKTKWHAVNFRICVDETPKGELITNFDQTKAAGHVAVGVEGSGLDVSCKISWSIPGEIDWNFGDKEKDSVRSGGLEQSHIYKKPGTFEGKVTVSKPRKKDEFRKFPVIMKEFKMTNKKIFQRDSKDKKYSCTVIAPKNL